MQITVTVFGQISIKLEVNPNDTYRDLLVKLHKMGIFTLEDISYAQFRFISSGTNEIDIKRRLKDNNIRDDGKIWIALRMRGGGAGSPVYSRYVNDEIDFTQQANLPISDSSKTSTRNTNVSLVHKQIGGTCYSHAAASAYINTCARIYGCKPPSFESALKVAKYKEGGGDPIESLKLMENKFQR